MNEKFHLTGGTSIEAKQLLLHKKRKENDICFGPTLSENHEYIKIEMKGRMESIRYMIFLLLVLCCSTVLSTSKSEITGKI